MQAFLFGASALLFEASALLSGLGAGAFKAMANLFEAMRNWLEREGNCLGACASLFSSRPRPHGEAASGFGALAKTCVEGIFLFRASMGLFSGLPLLFGPKDSVRPAFLYWFEEGPMGDGFGDIHWAARRFRFKQGFF